MPFISPSVDTFLVTSLLIVTPSWYILRRRHRPRPPRPNNAANPNQLARPPYERALTLAVHLHTLYILYLLIVHWPPNLFSVLHIPLITPSEHIRSILLDRAGLKGLNDTLPRPLEDLLTKLSNADVRTSYVRCVSCLLVALVCTTRATRSHNARVDSARLSSRTVCTARRPTSMRCLRLPHL